MKEMIQSIYDAVNEIVYPFKTIYPFQDIEGDVDTGVVTFAPVRIKNLTLAGEQLGGSTSELIDTNANNPLIVDAFSEIFFEVDIYKSINYLDNEKSAFDMAEHLQIYLKSSAARDKFFKNYQYELMPIWSDVRLQADFNTYKKWVQIAQFEIAITKKTVITLSDKKLKSVDIKINEINNIGV